MWCTVEALAEAHKIIDRLKAKKQRIAFAPINLSGGERSRPARGGLLPINKCVRAAVSPRGTGLTFVQICKIMRAYPRGRASDIRFESKATGSR